MAELVTWQYARRRKHVETPFPYRHKWRLVEGIYRPNVMIAGDVVRFPSGRLGLYAPFGLKYVLLKGAGDKTRIHLDPQDRAVVTDIQTFGVILKADIQLEPVDEPLPFNECAKHLRSEIRDIFKLYLKRWKQ